MGNHTATASQCGRIYWIEEPKRALRMPPLLRSLNPIKDTALGQPKLDP